MTPITVEGKHLWVVSSLPNWDCKDCALNTTACVRIKPETKELYFDTSKVQHTGHMLYCIDQEVDIVFIKNTPKQIAKYVAARLEST